jgi:hypothetical protein
VTPVLNSFAQGDARLPSDSTNPLTHSQVPGRRPDARWRARAAAAQMDASSGDVEYGGA